MTLLSKLCGAKQEMTVIPERQSLPGCKHNKGVRGWGGRREWRAAPLLTPLLTPPFTRQPKNFAGDLTLAPLVRVDAFFPS